VKRVEIIKGQLCAGCGQPNHEKFLKENWRVWQFTVTVHKAVQIISDTFISPKTSTLLQYKQ
jgi:hypothetical protein